MKFEILVFVHRNLKFAIYFLFLQTAICGGEMNLETGGRLESPNYPLEYLPSKECIWKITVPKEFQVSIFFINLISCLINLLNC